MTKHGPAPTLLELRPSADVRGIALLAHGGRSRSTATAHRLQGPALRMYPFTFGLRREGGRAGLLAAQLGYRLVGYNDGDPVADVEWALDRLAHKHPGVPVCLVGHSMGGRACLRSAGHAAVRAVVGLAPWLPPGEPVAQLAGRSVVLVHGTRDRVTDPSGSLLYTLAAQRVADRAVRFEIERSGHAMLERATTWQRLTRQAVLGLLGLRPLDARIASAFAVPAQDSARIVL